MTIYNLTQHKASSDQLVAGVVDLQGDDLEELLQVLNFTSIPSVDVVKERSYKLVKMMEKLNRTSNGETYFMVGGAPYLMAALAKYAHCYDMVFAYSERVSEEKYQDDGSVIKVNKFKHTGFVPMCSIK